MAADDLFNVIPVPSLSATDLGVPDVPPPMAIPALAPTDMGIGPPPTPPVPVSTPVAHPQHGLSLALLALAGALGPKYGNGIPQGVVRGQDEARSLAQDQANKDAIQNAKQQAIYEQAQAKQQQAVDVRQKTLEGAVTSLRSQLSKVTDPKEYQTQVQGFANLMQASGYRVDANWVRQVAPYVAPSAQQRASTLLDKAMENPLTKAAMQQDPGKVIAGKISFDANGDGTPELYTIGELAALAGRPMITDPQTNQPIIPSKDQGKVGDAFQELLGNARATFRATNNRAPTAQEDSKLINMAVEKSKEKPPAVGDTTATSDITDNAQQLVDGDLLPSTLSKRAATYNATLAKANRLSMEQTGKPMNFVKLQLDYDAARRFVGSMNGPTQIRFRGLAGSVVNTIDEVKRLGTELQQGSIQKWNAAKRGTIQQLFGNTPESEQAAQYVAAVNTLKEEFANLANGGAAPTDPAWQLANGQINGDYGVRDLNASLTEVRRLINYRVNAINDQAPFTVGGASNQAPPDPAQTGLQKLNGR